MYLCGLRGSSEGVLTEVVGLWLLTSSVTSDFPLRHVRLQQVNICVTYWYRKKNNVFVILVTNKVTAKTECVEFRLSLFYWGRGEGGAVSIMWPKVLMRCVRQIPWPPAWLQQRMSLLWHQASAWPPGKWMIVPAALTQTASTVHRKRWFQLWHFIALRSIASPSHSIWLWNWGRFWWPRRCHRGSSLHSASQIIKFPPAVSRNQED